MRPAFGQSAKPVIVYMALNSGGISFIEIRQKILEILGKSAASVEEKIVNFLGR